MEITGMQIIGIIVAGIIFFEARVLYKKEKFTRRDFWVWGGISGILIVISIAPSLFNILLRFTNMRRTLDALIVLGILGLYTLVFHLYIRTQQTQREVTEFVRKAALVLEKRGKR